MKTDRRDFLKVLTTLGFAPSLLHAMASNAPGLPQPEVVGTLSATSKDILWRVFKQIGVIWKNSDEVRLWRMEFDIIIDLKTGSAPSYLTAYNAFARYLGDQIRVHGRDKAMNRLFFEEAGKEHAHLVAELIELQLVYGGFRMFGWKNYKGYQGGPFSNPEYTPYRVAERS